MEARSEVLKLHFFELSLIEQPGISGVVMDYLAVAVFLGGPQIVPAPPEAVISEIDSEEAVEMG